MLTRTMAATDVENNNSPRPLSHVRSNFVAIEKNGRLGLRQEGGADSSPTRQPLSEESNTETTSTLPEPSTNMASADDARSPQRRLFVNESVTESPRQPNTSGGAGIAAVSSALSEKASTIPDKTANEEEQQTASLRSEGLITKSKAAKSAQTTPAAAPNGKHATTSTAKTTTAKATTAKATTAKATTAKATTAKATTAKTTTARTSKAPMKPPVKAAGKAPAAPRAAAGTAGKPEAKPAVKAAEKPAAKKDTAATTRPRGSATKATSSTASKRPNLIQTFQHHPDAGFVKPKPKSPTKPVQLPSSLMAHTASSVSKGNDPRQSLSKLTANTQTPNAGRPSTRASMSTTTSTTKTVRRQGSTIGPSRPSIGPPPKKRPQLESESAKKESHVDEGFLTRMMRPTQSSSSKTSDKAPVTPPRIGAQRPATAASGASSRRESSARRVINAGSPAPAAPASLAPPTASTDVEEAAVETANVETAEEAKKIAHDADLIQKPEESALPEQDAPDVQSQPISDRAMREPAQEEVVEETPVPSLEVDPVQSTEHLEPEAADEAPSKEEIQPETPHEGPEQEEQEDAPKVEESQTPVQPMMSEPDEQKPVDDVVPEIAQVETAEAAIELAEEANLVQDSVEPEATTTEHSAAEADAEGISEPPSKEGEKGQHRTSVLQEEEEEEL